MPVKTYPKVFKFRGGHPALDFANTVHWHATPAPVELLTSYDALVDWAAQAGLVAAGLARRLRQAAAQAPARAEAVRQTALALREAVYRLFVARARGEPPAAADLATLNRHLAAAYARLRLVPAAAGYVWEWTAADPELERPLWPVARAAAELLTSPQLARVGQCADERGCGWLFLDTTKNGRRRWCATDDCGSINKARRYYRRQKARRAARR